MAVTPWCWRQSRVLRHLRVVALVLFAVAAGLLLADVEFLNLNKCDRPGPGRSGSTSGAARPEGSGGNPLAPHNDTAVAGDSFGVEPVNALHVHAAKATKAAYASQADGSSRTAPSDGDQGDCSRGRRPAAYDADTSVMLRATTFEPQAGAAFSREPPGRRYGHTLSVVGDRIFILGGGRHTDWMPSSENDFPDTSPNRRFTVDAMDAEHGTLLTVDASGRAPRRAVAHHAAVAVGRTLLVLGGSRMRSFPLHAEPIDDAQPLNHVFRFDTVTSTWSFAVAAGDADARAFHSATLVAPVAGGGATVLIAGGLGPSGAHTAVLQLNVKSLTLERWSASTPPMYGHACVASSSQRVVCFGAHAPASAAAGSANFRPLLVTLDAQSRTVAVHADGSNVSGGEHAPQHGLIGHTVALLPGTDVAVFFGGAGCEPSNPLALDTRVLAWKHTVAARDDARSVRADGHTYVFGRTAAAAESERAVVPNAAVVPFATACVVGAQAAVVVEGCGDSVNRHDVWRVWLLGGQAAGTQSYPSNVSVVRTTLEVWPQVTVVVPTYNDLDTLPRAVASFLSQSWFNLELVVVNDASPDGTGAWLDDAAKLDERLVVHHNEANKRLPRSLNVGFSLARGQYLTWGSSDNYYAAMYVEEQVRALRDTCPACGYAYADARIANDHGAVLRYLSREYGADTFFWSANGISFMYTRQAMEAVGGYDAELIGAEDWNYFHRIALRFPVVWVRGVCTAFYVTNAGTMTSNMGPTIAANTRKHLTWALSQVTSGDGRIDLSRVYPQIDECENAAECEADAAALLAHHFLRTGLTHGLLQKEAQRLAERAVALRPTWATALALCAMTSTANGDHARAAEMLTRLEALDVPDEHRDDIDAVRSAVTHKALARHVQVRPPRLLAAKSELIRRTHNAVHDVPPTRAAAYASILRL